MAIRWTDKTAHTALPTLAERSTGSLDVWIAPEAEASARRHIDGAWVERGGLLVGSAFADPHSGAVNHIRIVACVPAEEADASAVSLRMGSAVWTAAQARLAPDRLIVGWYHSHPGLTAFFSDTDRRTQRAFFNHAYSIGWVIDPLLDEEAWFVGPDSAPITRCR